MDNFSCYKLKTTTPPPFQEKKNSQKPKDCQIFSVIKVLGIQTLVFNMCTCRNCTCTR